MKILSHFSWSDGTIEKLVDYDNIFERVLNGGSRYCIEEVTAIKTTKKGYEKYEVASYVFDVDGLRSRREKVENQLLFSKTVPSICSDPIFEDICTLFTVLYLYSFEEGRGIDDSIIVYTGNPYWDKNNIKQNEIPKRFQHQFDVSKNNFYLYRISDRDGITIDIQYTDKDKKQFIYQCPNSKEFDQGESYFCGRRIKQLYF